MQNPNMDVLRVLYGRRKHIILITFLTCLVSVGVSYLLKPKYRSVSYVYPANMVPFFMEQQYNAVSHTELLLQFFNSNNVRKEVLKRFDLGRHYELDTADPRFNSYFNSLYEENIKATQTRYESVELDVLDTDPVKAQKIAEGIIQAVNNLIQKQHTQKFNEFIRVNHTYLQAHRRSMDSLQKCMEAFSKKYTLIDMGAQMREAAKNYYKLLSEGKENTKLSDEMHSLSEHGPEFYRLSNSLQEEARLYAQVENELEKSIRDFNRKLTYMIVASDPSLPDVKYWPKRGWIASISAISSFLLACLYFIYASRMGEVFHYIRKSSNSIIEQQKKNS